MKTHYECIPCLIRQSIEAIRIATGDQELQEQFLRSVLEEAARMDLNQSPPYMAAIVHRRIRELIHNKDPYYEIKKRFNLFALEHYEELKKKVDQSNRPFETALRLSIAGNIIDFGVKGSISEEEIHDTIEQSLSLPLEDRLVEDLREAIALAEKILFLADNAGEIVFDRLLLEQMPLDRVTYVVKAAPIINDATVEDAHMTGITGMVRVIDNGSDAPGTILQMCSPKFIKEFDQADLIIAKGQAHYETLSDDKHKPVFFLLKVKCPVVAGDIGFDVGSIALAGPTKK